MIYSLLIGLAGGMRSMTPLAAVAVAANRGLLPQDNGAPEWLGHDVVAAGAVALAAGELIADKHPSSPDRIIPPGIAARLVTGGLAGAALAPRGQRELGAVVGALAAVASAYVTWKARIRSMEQHGQASTGLVEDAVMMATTAIAVTGAGKGQRQIDPAYSSAVSGRPLNPLATR
jgi:uncharacterized membrane protein